MFMVGVLIGTGRRVFATGPQRMTSPEHLNNDAGAQNFRIQSRQKHVQEKQKPQPSTS